MCACGFRVGLSMRTDPSLNNPGLWTLDPLMCFGFNKCLWLRLGSCLWSEGDMSIRNMAWLAASGRGGMPGGGGGARGRGGMPEGGAGECRRGGGGGVGPMLDAPVNNVAWLGLG